MFISNTSVPPGAQDFPAPETAVWRFAPLVAHSYDVVVIDPPWHFNTWSPAGQTSKSAAGQYHTMPLAEIMALPVRELLKPDAIVYLWATGAMLPHALETMKALGIVYKTGFVWRKVTINGTATLTIGEGVETVLAARAAGFTPAWALGSSGAVRAFPVLQNLRELTILQENDPTSRQDVKVTGRRYLGRRRAVNIVEPKVGNDFNDCWKACADE